MTTSGEASEAPALPVPPPGGWTLQETLENLSPETVRLHNEGGPKLEAVLRAEMGEFAGLLRVWPEGHKRKQLYLALCARPDLELTGFDLTRGADAPRFRLPRDLLLSAGQRAVRLQGAHQIYLEFLIEFDRVRISYNFPEMRPGLPDDMELVAVRVELVETHSRPAGLPVKILDPNVLTGKGPKRTFSVASCRSWFRLFVHDYPKEKPPPNEAECLAAAREYYGVDIPRGVLRQIRRELAPPFWMKKGPRKPRN